MTNLRNDALVEALSVDFLLRGESLASVVADRFLALPGLRGFWPMSAFSASGSAIDQSGNIRTLTYNGNPTYNYDGFAPYIALDGTGDYLSRADEAGLDIIGTETYVTAAVRGLTMGGWFYANATTTSMVCMAKGTSAAPAYHLRIRGDAADQLQFLVVNGGVPAGATGSGADGTLASDLTWMFIVGRFIPSTEVSVFRDGNETVNAVGIPASIDNVGGGFQVGAFADPAQYLNGRASLCFLCCMALSDAIVDNLFQSSRGLFGI